MASESSWSLDGNRDNWVTGRKDPDGENWLAKYQGKNFERKRRINEYISKAKRVR